MPKYDVVSFLSDMGTVDESVGVCKAIIHQQAPHVSIIDITHDVAPFDVRAGALALTRAIQFLPNGIVIAAVDPGSPRDQRYIAVEMETGVLVGPDNGILAPAAQLIGAPKRVIELSNPEYRVDAPGKVFAARDILAPAAGVIAAGADLSVLGAQIPLEQLVPGMLQLSRHDEGGAFLGEIWSIDRFGNIQINITPEEFAMKNVNYGDSVTVRIANKDHIAKYVERYADLAISQLGVLIDSTGMISIVKNLDFASRELDVKEGKEVIILPQGATVTGKDVAVDLFASIQENNEDDTTQDGSAGGIAVDNSSTQESSASPVPSPQTLQSPLGDFQSPGFHDNSFSSDTPVIQQPEPQSNLGVTSGQIPSVARDPYAQVSQPVQSVPTPPQVFVNPEVPQDPSLPADPFATGPAPIPDYSYDTQTPPVQSDYPQQETQAQPPASGYSRVPFAQPPQPDTPTSPQFDGAPPYFPPPVEQPSAPHIDVAPVHQDEELQSQQSEQAGSLPLNVFDLFKNPEDTDSDPQQ